jgi:hypothetical protein
MSDAMRKVFLLTLVGTCCVGLLAGCLKKKVDAADGGDTDADVAPVVAAPADAAVAPATPSASAAAPVAKNAAEVARFPAGEKAIVDDDQKTVDLFAQARTGPKQGALVALVRAGTDPFKIAEFQDSVLITFPDPKDPNTTLMGWVSKDAFVRNTGDGGVGDAGAKDAGKDAAPPATGGLKCPAGQEAIEHLAATTVCRKKCSADKDCKVPSPGACANAKTNAGKITRVCAADLP